MAAQANTSSFLLIDKLVLASRLAPHSSGVAQQNINPINCQCQRSDTESLTVDCLCLTVLHHIAQITTLLQACQCCCIRPHIIYIYNAVMGISMPDNA